MHDPTLAWRSEFPILESTTYLVSHSLGAMPRAAASQLTGFTEAWARRGVRAWAEGWWEMPLALGDSVGRIIGAPAGSVVMQPNVSLCQALVLSCFKRELFRLAVRFFCSIWGNKFESRTWLNR